ncbi:MAG: OmpH family outer membrane protein [Bacteroidetes bacterium]|nr:OmpH family outer membrane protein [Bacteroidota bacterium]
MKKYLFLLVISAFTLAEGAFGQRFAYVDTEYILDMLPEYRSAQKQLDAISLDWEKEIDKKQEEIDKIYREFEAEKILLTEELKKKKETEIKIKEQELKDFRNLKFGYEGELFKKRAELIKPIQDKIFDAVQKIAKTSALDFIFAKGGEVIMLYSNSKYDKSDEVLKELGITISKTKNSSGTNPNSQPGGGNNSANPKIEEKR